MSKANPSKKLSMLQEHPQEKSPGQYLLEVGLKVTYPRLLILNLFHKLQGHYSADELVKILQEQQTPLPRASVYNTLDALLDRELIMMSNVGPGRTLYEVSKPWHHHFVCINCGTIIDIPCLKGEKPCLYPENFPGVIEEAQIIFRGHCQPCLLEAEENQAGDLATYESIPGTISSKKI